MTNISTYGIFPGQTMVTGAIDALKASGFRSADISVLYPDGLASGQFGHEKHTKAPEGAVAGGGCGAVIGATAGWLAGAGALLVPGLEPLSAAGPVLGLLSGAGAGLGFGGLTGALVGAGIPEYEAKRYSGAKKKAGILVSVHCDDNSWSKTARRILKQAGGADITSTREARADYANSQKPLPRRAEQPR